MIVSIIVCTRDRCNSISACLDSVEVAIHQASLTNAEIVVVNNGSTDNTEINIKNWAARHNIKLQLLNEPRKGLSIARNCALRVLRGELLIFTDDDCLMDKYYIVKLLQYANKESELVFWGGRVEQGDPEDLPLSIKTSLEPRTWRLKHTNLKHEHLGDSLLGCNMAMKYEVAQLLGKFDENLGAGSSIPGGEDTDYIYRAFLAGIKISYESDLVVTHFHGRNKPQDGQKLFKSYALGWGALYAKYIFKHPNLCRPFLWDLKNAFKEVIIQKNTFMPSVNFSHKDKVFYSLIGAFKYTFLSARQIFQR